MIDLGHWLTESYAVPSNQPLSESDVMKVLEHQKQNGNMSDDDEI
jgi:endogenous inhibitor of DNA gyrase (YacG/DUF329 family)